MCSKRWIGSFAVAGGLAAVLLSLPMLAPMFARDTGQSKEPLRVTPTDRFSAPFEEVAAVISPSLVSIISTKVIKTQATFPQLPEEFRHFFGDDFFGRSFPQSSPKQQVERALGSGLIVSDNGLILTNAHVVDGAESATVRLPDDRTLQAKVIGRDTLTDLAVLKVNATDLRPAKLGDSDKIEVGEWVVAAGIPFGLSHTVTTGVISAKSRSNVGISDYEDFIQTDAPINPGNSGGPLLNLKGEVIGINTAIFTQSGGSVGIGFAIPINMAKSVMHNLVTTGHVVRGWLGVAIQKLTPDLAKSFDSSGTKGALVGDVNPDTPAAKAGIKQGDIITQYEGKQVTNPDDLRSLVVATKPGTEVKVQVFRDGKEKTLQVKIGEMPTKAKPAQPSESAKPAEQKLGMTVETLTPDMAQELGEKNVQGVVVTGVTPGGPAESAGIRAKDVIVSVQGKPVTNADEFHEAMSKQNLKEGVRLVVRTGSAERFVFVRSTEEQ